MTVSNPIRLGADSKLASPSFDDLLLPVFGGEVLMRYNEAIVATNMVRRRNITSGNTARFPRLGGISAERHSVGSKLLGLDSERTEIVITLDERPLVSHFRTDDIDEMLSHFESRSEMSAQSGEALAEAQERFTMRLLINAATTAAPPNTNFPGGGQLQTGAPATDSDLPATPTGAYGEAGVGAILNWMDDVAVAWDINRIPFPVRNVMIVPTAWHEMKNFGSPRSATDLNNGRTPLFQAADGTYGSNANPGQFITQMPDFNTPLQYNGFNIWRSNLTPFGQDLSQDDEVKYQGDFSLNRALAWQQDAIGILTLMDVMTESERDVSRQDFLFVTKMLSGGGTLRPEAADVLNDA